MAAMRDRGPKIITVEAPPRHGKSEYLTKYLPTWFVGRYPRKQVKIISYSDTLANVAGRFSLKLFRRIGPEWWGVGVDPRVQGSSEWETTAGGGVYCTGVGGGLTGRGADLMIVDDPIKNAEEAISERVREGQWEWFQSTAWTRLEPGATLIIVMTRWHQDDLMGKVHKMAEEKNLPITKICFPAIAGEDDPLGRQPGEALWPERLPLSYLEQRRAGMVEYWWQALYQQNPGQYGKSEWPDEYFEEPFWAESWPRQFESFVCALDPSKGRTQGSKLGDFSAIVGIGLRGGLMWVDADIERRPVTKIVRDSLNFAGAHHPIDAFGIEVNHFQELLWPEFERSQAELRLPPLPIVPIENMTRKELRISRLGPYLARHRFRFRDNAGTRQLVSQLKSFPFGEYDDGPDALEMAIRVLHDVLYGDDDTSDESVDHDRLVG